MRRVFFAQVPKFDYYKADYAFTKKENDKLFGDYDRVEYIPYHAGYAYYLVKAKK